MKKSIMYITVLFVMVFFSQCNNTTTDDLTSNADSRGKIISQLMNNETYMSEVMDSMKSKHGMSGGMEDSKNKMDMSMDMMSKMMDKCKTDTAMCKMMMDKTMDMCDQDSSKCKMMMESMKSHPKSMKMMQDMGMGKMKDMKM